MSPETGCVLAAVSGAQLAGVLWVESFFCCRIMEEASNSDEKCSRAPVEELEDSVCVKTALNYISNHQSACQQDRAQGLDISPTCAELTQHFTCKAFQNAQRCKVADTRVRAHFSAKLPLRRRWDINLFVCYSPHRL